MVIEERAERKSNPKFLLVLDEIELRCEGLAGKAGEELKEPGDELRRELLRFHALALHRHDDPLVVAHMLRHSTKPPIRITRTQKTKKQKKTKIEGVGLKISRSGT